MCLPLDLFCCLLFPFSIILGSLSQSFAAALSFNRKISQEMIGKKAIRAIHLHNAFKSNFLLNVID